MIVTGVLVICKDDTKCAKSCRHYANQAARGVVTTTLELVRVFAQHVEHVPPNHAAQKTGAVWSTCDALVKVPHGNRNAIRRELFTYIMECNETMEEFEGIIQLGPKVNSLETVNQDEILENTNSTTVRNTQEEVMWGEFLDGDSEQYSETELPIATCCLCLIKCSRGSLNVTLKACEHVGHVVENSNNDDENGNQSPLLLLEWIRNVTSLARLVGNGMTDLGTCLYPPLNLNGDNDNGNDSDTSLIHELVKQRDAVVALTDFILDAPIDLPEEVTEVASNIKGAANTRYEEATNAIAAALEEST